MLDQMADANVIFPQKKLCRFVFLTAMYESACFPTALKRESDTLKNFASGPAEWHNG